MSWIKGKKRPELMGENNPSKRLEVRLKISEANKGKKRSEETREKLRELNKEGKIGMKGRKQSEYQRQIMKGNRFGYLLTEKSRKNLSERMKQSKGEKAPNWQGGKSFEIYPQEFNTELTDRIKERYYHTCQLCDIVNKNKGLNERQDLCIHHIDYNKCNCIDDNLIVLCRRCNSVVNFNRNYYINYFQSVI